MSNEKVLELAQKFAEAVDALDQNKEFHMQRTLMWHFYVYFYKKMRALLGQMEGDLRTLKETNFDPHMLKLYAKSYRDLLEILKTTDKEKPYIMAENFIKYMTSRPTGSVLENLDFLIQHHLKNNEVDFKTGPMMGQVHIDTIESLRELAKQVQNFIAKNPPIPIPGDSEPPPAINLLNISPDQQVAIRPPQEMTVPGNPLSKKKLAI